MRMARSHPIRREVRIATRQMRTEDIARELLDAFDSGGTIASIVARNPGFEWEQGYRVAAEILRMRCSRGERVVGRKIGFTNRNIWAEYGATAPIWAHVYDRTLVRAEDHRATVSLRGSARPRLEPEIAFRLTRPLEAGLVEPSRILERVEWIAASFEIVDCHFEDWKFRSADSVADFALHWRLVLGAPHYLRSDEIPDLARQLHDCRVTLRRDGAVVDRGVGANALGHPAAALAHLADVLARQPLFGSLEAGEVITTGTLTAAMPIQPGETWSSEYEGLPVSGLTLSFAP